MCRRNFGRPADEPFPYETLVASIYPDDHERQQQAVRAAIEARSGFEIEYRLITPAGETRCVAIRGRYEDGEHPRLVGVSLDITERKRAEQAMRESEARQGFLLKLSDALRAEPNADAILELAVRMLAEELRLNRCYATAMYPAEDRVDVIAEFRRHDLAPMSSPLRFSDFPEAGKQSFNGTLIFEDTANDPALTETDRRALAAMQFGALLSAMVRKGTGNPVWAIGAMSAQPRRWRPDEVALIEEAAEHIWGAVERARMDDALRASEKKYRLLFDSLDEGVTILEAIFDEQGKALNYRYIENNPAVKKIFGFEWPIGKTVLDILPDVEYHWIEAVCEVARTGKATRTEYTVDRLNKWVSACFVRVGGPDSRRVVAVYADITERKRIGQVMRESAERQTFLLKLSDALREETGPRAIALKSVTLLAGHMRLDRAYVAVVDKDGDRAEIGPEYRRADLMPVEGVLTLSDFPDAFAQVEAHTLVLEDTASDPSLSDLDRRSFSQLAMRALIVASARKGAQNPVWALLVAMAAPRPWTPGEIALVEEVAERTWSAVERARVENALLENQRQLEEASRAKDQFLAMLGHELRNPLAPIVTTLQLMKLRAPDTFKHEREIIASQVHYLVDMVDDLLDVSRIARGDLKLEKQPLRLADVIAEAGDTVAWALTEHRQALHTNVDPGLTVLGDRRRLVQVLVNLLVNAAKYSPPDRRIDIDAVAEGAEAVIRVRDQGNGMDAALQSRVFEAFSQAEQSSDRRRGGLGLGLAIVRNIVGLHGGSVTAASDGKDKGSEFTVRLPLLQEIDAASPDEADVAEMPARSGSVSTRVLLVDDHVAGAQSMGTLLEAMGYDVHIERSGRAALAAVTAYQPAIAMLDIGLPDMDGYALARALRAMPEFSRLPMIALTGYGQAEDRERARSAGFDEHVTKPVRADDLGPLIEKLAHAR